MIYVYWKFGSSSSFYLNIEIKFCQQLFASLHLLFLPAEWSNIFSQDEKQSTICILFKCAVSKLNDHFSSDLPDEALRSWTAALCNEMSGHCVVLKSCQAFTMYFVTPLQHSLTLSWLIEPFTARANLAGGLCCSCSAERDQNKKKREEALFLLHMVNAMHVLPKSENQVSRYTVVPVILSDWSWIQLVKHKLLKI